MGKFWRMDQSSKNLHRKFSSRIQSQHPKAFITSHDFHGAETKQDPSSLLPFFMLLPVISHSVVQAQSKICLHQAK